MNQRHQFLAGKSDSRCHSARGLKGNLSCQTNYQMLEVLSFCEQERAQTSFNKDNFSGEKKYKEAFRVSIIWEYVRKPKSKSRTRSRSCPRI